MIERMHATRHHGERVRCALAVDAMLGEPPAACHPTVWMGRWLDAARQLHVAAPRRPVVSLLAGAATLVIGAGAAALVASTAAAAVRRLPHYIKGAAGGALLKPALSLRALLAAGREVEDALRRDDLSEARRLLAWHLVSRDTTRLSATEVAGAAIESLAENLSDGVVAPLFWHTVAGLPGAYAYRFVNTADAMLGYRTPELEWFGKAAARADDVLNLAPARISACLIAAVAAMLPGGSTSRALRVARRDASRTPSLNAGWPMAAMAGALDVRLDKRVDRADSTEPPAPRRVRHLYVLNANGLAPTVQDLARARRMVLAAAMLGTALAQLQPPGGRAA